jgi:hypothetical protein
MSFKRVAAALLVILAVVNLCEVGSRHFYLGRPEPLGVREIVNLCLLGATVLGLVVDFRRGAAGWTGKAWAVLRELPIPRAVRLVFGALLVIQAGHVLVHKTVYPISTVEMFSHAPRKVNRYPVYTMPKYYHLDDQGVPHVIHLRKEHLYGLADYLGWRATNEYTFSANYDFLASEKNYELLLEQLKPLGIERIYAGVEQVNFRKGTVVLLRDPKIIARRRIYVPPYQRLDLDD